MLNKCVVYIDELSAWRAPVAGFIVQFLLMGYIRSCSLLLIGIGDDFDIPESLLLSTAVVTTALEKLMALLAERITHICSAKTAVLVSMIMSVSSTLILFLIPITDVTVMCFLGVGMGIASALAPVPVYSTTAQAIKKRRGTAISLVKSGASVGAMCLPPLMVLLMDSYGARGALLVFSGILCNGIIAAVLLPSVIINSETGKAVTRETQCSCHRCCWSKGTNDRNENVTEEMSSGRPKKSKLSFEKKPLLVHLPALIHFCVVVMIVMTSFSQLSSVYQMFASDSGIPKYMIAATLSVLSCFDLCFRFVFGFLSDRLKNRGRLLMLFLLLLATGCATVILGIVRTNLTMAFSFTIIFGVGLAQFAVGWIPIMVGFTDITFFARYMSLTLAMVGLLSLAFIFIINKILTEMKSYRPLIIVYGTLIIMCSFNCLISALIFQRCTRPDAINGTKGSSESEEDDKTLKSENDC